MLMSAQLKGGITWFIFLKGGVFWQILRNFKEGASPPPPPPIRGQPEKANPEDGYDLHKIFLKYNKV